METDLPANWRKRKRSTVMAARIRFVSVKILEERGRAFRLSQECVDEIVWNSAGEESDGGRWEEEARKGVGVKTAQALDTTAVAV